MNAHSWGSQQQHGGPAGRTATLQGLCVQRLHEVPPLTYHLLFVQRWKAHGLYGTRNTFFFPPFPPCSQQPLRPPSSPLTRGRGASPASSCLLAAQQHLLGWPPARPAAPHGRGHGKGRGTPTHAQGQGSAAPHSGYPKGLIPQTHGTQGARACDAAGSERTRE